MKKTILILSIFFIFSACSQYSGTESVREENRVSIATHPKNIILMIGDGMGLSQITAGMFENDNKLNLEQFTVMGLQKTHSASSLITDSAAAATAFASGIKTYNGAIGVNVDTQAVTTILEEAENNGLATGLVATATIVHATPAAFIAHTKSRNDYEDIALYFVQTPVDLFIGGGKKYFSDRKKDDRNLCKELEEKGYYVSDCDKDELSKMSLDFDKKLAFFTSDDAPVRYTEGREYLVPASQKAPVFLDKKSDKGFFLMIEGSQIDWGGHGQSIEYIVSEMIDFDNAIGAVLDFAKKNGETLVIVTSDHETGGFAIGMGSRKDSLIGNFTTKGHTAAMMPVFAYGPGAELFGGIYENTAIYDKMKEAFDFEDR